jgi:glutamate-1-semialdehyde 2,1-aminomutase
METPTIAAAPAANATLDAALDEVHRHYTQRNPKSFAAFADACAAMPGGNTRTVLFFKPFPLRFARGDGARLWDADGHEYRDFLGEYTAGIFGHSHPAIRRAIEGALDGGLNLGGHNLIEAKFATAVCARFGFERVRFTNSGTEGNLMALSLATAITGRRKIMVFEGGYHGGVFYFAAAGGSPINAPFEYVLAPYNDAERSAALIREHAPDLAAVIVEPMLGSGGCIPADRDFLQTLRDATTAHDVLLIFDEVMTSRLHPGGLQAAHGIRPDLTSIGKYVGGGMSFGGFGGRADLMDRFDPRHPQPLPHGGTFNNNVLTMAAGHIAITQVYTPEAAVELNRRGDALRNRLNEVARRHDAPIQFTGRGSMMAVHMTPDPIRSRADAAKGNAGLREVFFHDLLASGIYLAPRGMINLSLPLVDPDLDRLVEAVEEFVVSRRSLMSTASAAPAAVA